MARINHGTEQMIAFSGLKCRRKAELLAVCGTVRLRSPCVADAFRQTASRATGPISDTPSDTIDPT